MIAAHCSPKANLSRPDARLYWSINSARCCAIHLTSRLRSATSPSCLVSSSPSANTPCDTLDVAILAEDVRFTDFFALRFIVPTTPFAVFVFQAPLYRHFDDKIHCLCIEHWGKLGLVDREAIPLHA